MGGRISSLHVLEGADVKGLQQRGAGGAQTGVSPSQVPPRVVFGRTQSKATHTLLTELSTPEIRMKLSLLKVSGEAKSLGCEEQQKREILSQGWAGSFEKEVS